MNVDKKIEEARTLISKNKLHDAKIIFQNIIKIQPNHYKAYTNIGAIHLKLDELYQAEKNFKKAISLKPEFEIAFYNLGITQKRLNKIKEAISSFKEAINLKENYAEAHTNLGTIYLELNNLDNAENCFKKAIFYRPDFAEAHYDLGVTLGKKNKFDQAEISYKNAIRLRPGFEDAIYNLKKIWRQNKLLLKIDNIKKNKNSVITNVKSSIGLIENPFISKRHVEKKLINELYKIDTVELNKTIDVRYGNGVCSDYELFENNSSILKIVEKDLTNIMRRAVQSEIFIIESFFNILQTGSGLASHNHLNDFDKTQNLKEKKYSLTYYLSIGDQNCTDPGILKLYDPEIEILPSTGTIVIFPASRHHSATYNGKTDRVMIGINFYSIN